jgi:hypothetical protein
LLLLFGEASGTRVKEIQIYGKELWVVYVCVESLIYDRPEKTRVETLHVAKKLGATRLESLSWLHFMVQTVSEVLGDSVGNQMED